jgi:preprotein translocase subunit SecE
VDASTDSRSSDRVERGEVTSVSDSKAVRGSRSSGPQQRTSLATFYRQVVAELRKVVWPTQEQLVTYFIVVMAFVLFMMALVSVLDLAFGKLVFAIFSGGSSS